MLLPRAPWLVAAFCLSSPAFAQSRPNIEAISVEGPLSAIAGEPAMLSVTFDVRGAPPAFRWSAYLTSNGAVQGSLRIGTFGPVAGQPGTNRLEQAVSIPTSAAAGSYFLAIEIDPAGAIAESNEYDNVVVSQTRLRLRVPAADLRISGVRPLIASGRTGDLLAVQVDVINEGETDASAPVAVYLSSDQAVTTSDPEIGRAAISLAAGERTTVRIEGPIPTGLFAGDHVLGAIADPALSVPEADEIDNLGLAPDPFNVFEDQLRLVSLDLPAATVFIPYFARLEARGGDGRYRFAIIRGRLPAGLRLSGATGEITGTPLESGAIQAEIEVRSGALVDLVLYTVLVRQSGVELTIVTPALETATLGLPYQGALVAAGGEPPYRWQLQSGAVPAGLDLGSDGVLRGVPTQEGHYAFIAEVSDALGGRLVGQFSMDVDAPNVAVLSGALSPLPVGEPVSIRLLVTGGLPPYDWNALSAPPPGLTLGEDGVLVGTPTSIGRFAVRVRVTDSGRHARSDTALLQVVVEDAGTFELVVGGLSTLEIREELDLPLEARGGTAPFAWRLAHGSTLPAGFALEVDGDVARIRGRSIRPIAHPFTVEVKDAAGRQRAAVLLLEVERTARSSEGGCRCTTRTDTGLATLLMLAGLVIVLRRRV